MKYKPKSIGALHIALGGTGHCSVCKDRRRTAKDNVVAREFGDNNAPQERHSESVVKVNKASVATHYPPRR